MGKSYHYSDEELWGILKKHKDAITSVAAWNRYAKKHKLPHSQTFINRFGSWNEIKKKLNLNINQQHRPSKYSKEELYEILRKHNNAYKNIYQWNQYAKKHKLPSHDVFVRHLGLKELESIVGVSFSGYSIENIAKQIREHFPHKPPTVDEWKRLSRTKKLVSESTIISKFGSWNNMKSYVYMKNNPYN